MTTNWLDETGCGVGKVSTVRKRLESSETWRDVLVVNWLYSLQQHGVYSGDCSGSCRCTGERNRRRGHRLLRVDKTAQVAER